MFSDFILPSQDIGRYILPKGSTVEPLLDMILCVCESCLNHQASNLYFLINIMVTMYLSTFQII